MTEKLKEQIKLTRKTDKRPDREKIIISMLPQVKYYAIRIFNQINRSVELNDLISAGVLGLIDALDRFDPKKGVKFQTYASFRIQGAIKDTLRKMDWASRGQRYKRKLYEKTFIELYNKLGRNPTDNELAESLQMNSEEWKNFVSNIVMIHIGSFSQIENDDEKNIIQYIPDENPESNPFYNFSKKELWEILSKEIDKLPTREALVLSLYYYDELNMKEVGKVLGVTESRVSQIHNHAILKLKAQLLKASKNKNIKANSTKRK